MRREHESWGEGWIMPASVLAFLVFRNAMRSPTANVWEVLLTMAGVAFGAWAALVVVAFALATIGWLFNRWCERAQCRRAARKGTVAHQTHDEPHTRTF